MSNSLTRIRALRAAHAVTLGGLFVLPACGDPSTADSGAGVSDVDDAGGAGSDVSSDTGGDTGLPDADLPDAATDATPDAPDTGSDTAPTDVAVDTGDDVPSDVAADAGDDDASDLGNPDSADTADADGPDADATDADATDADPTDAVETDVSGPDGGETPCKEFEDNACDPSCTRDNDFDCCIDGALPGEFCSFDPSFGCVCAIEGPFAPPSLPRRTYRLPRNLT